MRITVCNNRCWPNPVLFVAATNIDLGFRLLNAAIQWFMSKKLMFKCADFLQGRELTVWTLRQFIQQLPEPQKHIEALRFLVMRV